MNINIPLVNKMVGRFQLLVKDSEGRVKQDTGWFDNLITNQGLDWIGAGSPMNGYSYPYLCTHCGVGTGNTLPTVADTQLTSFLAMSPSSNYGGVMGFSSSTYIAGPPAYWSGIFTYNFAIGQVVGNIAEVGCGNTNSTDTEPQLFSHALILDGAGNPTTISLTSSDALVVNYELRMYLDLTDNTYSMSISGTTYGGTYRRSYIPQVPNFALATNTAYEGVSLMVYNGSLGSVTGQPSGYSDGNNTSVIASYNVGTYTTSITTSFSLSQGNLSGGITAIETQSVHGNYQFAVSPAIPKTSAYTLTITWSITWARYP